MEEGRRVVARVDARERVADALAEVGFPIGATDAIVHRLLKGRTREEHFTPDAKEDDAHARILTDGHLFPSGDLCIFENAGEGKFCCARLCVFRLSQGSKAILRDVPSCLYGETADHLCNFSGIDLFHGILPNGFLYYYRTYFEKSKVSLDIFAHFCYNEGMERQIGTHSELKEAGIAFSLVSLLPVLCAFVLQLCLQASGAEGYETADWYLYLCFLFPQLCTATAALVYALRTKRRARTLYRPCKPYFFLLAVALQFGLLFSLAELNGLFISLLQKLGYHPLGDSALPSLEGWGLLPAIVVIALLPAFFEETLFRGELLQSMESGGWGTVPTVLISGLLFSLFHQNPEQTIYQFCCGACFALLAIRAGSVFPGMVAHFLNNALILVLTSQGIGSLSGTAAYLPVLVLSSVCLVLSFAALLFVGKGKGRKGKPTGDFFLAAGVGIAICVLQWTVLLISRCIG